MSNSMHCVQCVVGVNAVVVVLGGTHAAVWSIAQHVARSRCVHLLTWNLLLHLLHGAGPVHSNLLLRNWWLPILLPLNMLCLLALLLCLVVLLLCLVMLLLCLLLLLLLCLLLRLVLLSTLH